MGAGSYRQKVPVGVPTMAMSRASVLCVTICEDLYTCPPNTHTGIITSWLPLTAPESWPIVDTNRRFECAMGLL